MKQAFEIWWKTTAKRPYDLPAKQRAFQAYEAGWFKDGTIAAKELK